MYITNTLLGFTSTRFLALEKELFCQLALEGDSVEGFLHWLQRICRLGSLNMMYEPFNVTPNKELVKKFHIW